MENQTFPFIAYYGVSTKQQGQNTFGLEAQRTQVVGYIGSQAQLVRGFIEVESGKRSSRPESFVKPLELLMMKSSI